MIQLPTSTVRRLGVSLAVLAAIAVSALAEPKIGIIDLKKVFDGYYKTKQADSQLKDRAGDAEKVLKGMVDDYQKAQEDYKKLVDSSNDQAVSADERDKRKKTSETKLIELQEIDKSIVQFRRQTQGTLDEQKRRMRDNILKEIREVINTKAKSAGFTLVLDTAAESVNQTPVLMYTNGENDVSDEILTTLNANAPVGALDAKDKPASAIDAPAKASPAPKK